MQDHRSSPPSLLEPLSTYLRETHLARGSAYLGIAALTMQSIGQLFPQHKAYSSELLHLSILPLTLAVTRAFAQLRPDDQAAWQSLDFPHGLREAGLGAAFGAAALLGTLGIARTQGWVSAPEWGWRSATKRRVAASMAMIALGQLAVAWNEELVFRGYGLTTMRRAMPAPAADALLTGLFALAHPLKPLTLAGEAALGLVLLGLRQRSGHIWMSVGYHWAWNVLQSAVLGPVDGQPSLRPLRVHGPPIWVGRPGHPDPGILTLLVCLGLALALELGQADIHEQ